MGEYCWTWQGEGSLPWRDQGWGRTTTISWGSSERLQRRRLNRHSENWPSGIILTRTIQREQKKSSRRSLKLTRFSQEGKNPVNLLRVKLRPHLSSSSSPSYVLAVLR